MDPQVVAAVIAGCAAFLVAALAHVGTRSRYPAEYMDDVRQDLQVMRAERDAALAATARALTSKGEVEAYARQLEERIGLPHRRWTDHPIDPEGHP